MAILHIDFETRSTLNLKEVGIDVYSKHPTTDVWCIGWSHDDGPAQLITKETLLNERRWLIPEGRVIAHNAPFELAIWNNIMVPKYDWPPLMPEQTYCTMAMAYAMGLPGALENVAPALGIDKQKDMSGHRIMLQLSQPRRIEEDGTIVWWDDPVKIQRLYDYCKQDVEVEREVHKRLLELSPSEREVWLLDYEINQRGVNIDLKNVNTAIKLAEFERNRLDTEMRRVTNNAVATCTATGQLTDWLRLNGLTTAGVAKDDVLELLELPNLPKACRQALMLRQEAAKSSTRKLEAMKNRTSPDGRIRNTTQYHGASTGRWAGRGLQVHNLPRPKLEQYEIEKVFEILGSVECQN